MEVLEKTAPIQNKRWSGERFLLLFFALTALFLANIPFVHAPFSWIMVFFHEISHGLAALATGGTIIRIHLTLSGSGLCQTQGGVAAIILLAGYMGAILWGILLYRLADGLGARKMRVLAMCLAALVALVALLYGRDSVTLFILALLFAGFLSISFITLTPLSSGIMKFLGVYVLLDAARAPLHLIDNRPFIDKRPYGDGAALANLTGIAEIFWVLLWLIFAVMALFYLWARAGRCGKSAI